MPLPPLSLLDVAPELTDPTDHTDTAAHIRRVAGQHRIELEVPSWQSGPAVTRYLLEPGPGVTPEKIEKLTSTFSVRLGAAVRYAGVVGTAVGLEVPNLYRAEVSLRSLIEHGPALTGLGVPVGRSVSGDVVTGALAKLPHLLIAGATGQGKSVFINALLVSLLMRNTPADLQLTLIDPKRVELTAYAAAPHLARPIVTEVTEAVEAVEDLVARMEDRYQQFQHRGVKDVQGWNDLTDAPHWSRHVLVVDELADLMATGGKALEGHLARLAQLGRAAGIHLVLATQYPRADVVTQLIKQNIPSRICFTVADPGASALVLGAGAGADKLTGSGDALWAPVGQLQPERVQTPYVSADEITRVLAWWVDATAADRNREAVLDKLRTDRLAAEAREREVAASARAAAQSKDTEAARATLTGALPGLVYDAPTERSLQDELREEIIAEARAARAREQRLPERVEALEALVLSLQQTVEQLQASLSTLIGS